MLRRVYVDNLRCFVNFELQPGQLNLVLGDNGSGKTTLVDALAIMSDFIARGSDIPSLTAFTSRSAFPQSPWKEFCVVVAIPH